MLFYLFTCVVHAVLSLATTTIRLSCPINPMLRKSGNYCFFTCVVHIYLEIIIICAYSINLFSLFFIIFVQDYLFTVLAFTHYRYLNLFDSRLKQAQSNIRKRTYELSIIGTSTAQQKICVHIATKRNIYIPCPLRQILLCEGIAYDTSTYDRPNTCTQLPAPIVSMRNGSL